METKDRPYTIIRAEYSRAVAGESSFVDAKTRAAGGHEIAVHPAPPPATPGSFHS
jgi:hypothetical protein